MKIKVSEATSIQLNWLVAKCENAKRAMLCGAGPSQYVAYIPKNSAYRKYEPCNNWKQGGPIINNRITKLEDYGDCWGAEGPDAPEQFGPTPLIAAMRCYVSSKLGDEVEVPEEIK